MRTAWKRIVLTMLVFVVAFMNVQQVEAASTQSVKGTCEYDKAYEVLELVNKEREKAGLSKLVMDKELLEAAMVRAAEIVVLFDHNRPNGSECFTACDKMYGENIAMGQGTADYVMECWMNSSGHKANILQSAYKSIGIGCFYKNGRRYWVQCFGFATATSVTKPKNCERTYKVSLTSGVETTIDATAEEEDESEDTLTKVSNFKVTAGKKKLILKWKKQTGIDGYEIQVSTGKSFKSKQAYTVGKNKTKKTVTKYKGKKLKAKKKYYVRIRAYKNITNEDGTVTTQYSKWNTKNKKTK